MFDLIAADGTSAFIAAQLLVDPSHALSHFVSYSFSCA
jgi:hypothetical protein